ncbi:hypothetical protein [Brevundimonas sp. GCM10030266]|uniref:hypothetical protein n=1 Tax=Brevundimonas sp. GCM10030266 TaxID=3273386 RepID=UPI003619A886
MIARLTFIAALAFAPMAAAQDATPAPATSEQLAAARAEADRLIAVAEAGDLFVNITGNANPMVRHRGSGLICIFRSFSEINRITIYPGGERGEDVSCSTLDPETSAETTVYATKYAPLPSEEAILADAMRAITQRFPSARAYEGDIVNVTADDVAPITAAFLIETNLGPRFTMATVEHLDGWGFKLRATGPADKAREISAFANTGFATMLVMRRLPPFSGD